MAVLLAERVERPATLFPGGGPTLDEAIVGMWEALAAQAAVACPLCGGTLGPHAAAATGELLGRCRDCGTTLA
jgi:hypothetical protein